MAPVSDDWMRPFADNESMAEPSKQLDLLIQQRRVKYASASKQRLIPTVSSDRSLLLDLPGELRNRIYKLVVTKVPSSADNPIQIFSEPYALPHVCKLFGQEVDISRVYRGQYYFHTVPFFNFRRLEQWMNFVGSKNINSLKEIRIGFAGTRPLRDFEDAVATFSPLTRMVTKHGIRPGVVRFNESSKVSGEIMECYQYARLAVARDVAG